MALVKFGGGISQVVGSAGGTTFQRSRAGGSMRSRIAGVQPRTTQQGFVRSGLSDLSKYYSALLSAADQAAWRAFASANPVVNVFGDTMLLSGIAMFVRLNTNLLMVGGTRIDTPPASLVVQSLTASNPTIVAQTSVAVGASGPALLADEKILFWATPALPAGRFYVNREYVTIHVGAAVAASYDVTAAWESRFGTIPQTSGQIFWSLAQIINSVTGAASPVVRGSDYF